MFKSIVYIWMCLGLVCCLSIKTEQKVTPIKPLTKASFGQAEQTGTIVAQEISEASGLAVSFQDPDILWIINDSGNPPVLFAVRKTGQLMASYTIVGAKNRDWEDLAAFTLHGTPYLIIADTGDNRATRDVCSLYIIKEPTLPAHSLRTRQQAHFQYQIRFRYANGPRDCEAVAVDARQQTILLLTKRTSPPLVYELPFERPPDQEIVTAQKIATLPTIPPPTTQDLLTKYGQYRSQPTAMDISQDGNVFIVLTYKDAYSFRRQSGQTWQTVLTTTPLQISLPHPDSGVLKQREALAIDYSTGNIFVTSEQIPAGIFCLQRQEQ